MKVFNQIQAYAKRPEIYEEGSMKLWEDPHISKGMLEAHLSPDEEGASREHSFIDSSVDWIESIAPPNTHPNLIDFGCGPGMYTSRLAKKGYNVVGIDISKRSIAYAKDYAILNDLSIDYRVGNYLEFNDVEKYDVAILIYCDYGVLSDEARLKILNNIHRALKPGGKLIFDVFTPRKYDGIKEIKEWYISGENGFFKRDEHLCLKSHLIYNEFVHLDQYLLIDQKDQVDVIRVWDHCFTPETLLHETAQVGFECLGYFSDAKGMPYGESSKTLCMILEK
jgi:SAM-dependent methyltransferase